ncbi:MAG: hypothetical protein V1909_03440 [Candidatus Micrarchaeota archaeon]
MDAEDSTANRVQIEALFKGVSSFKEVAIRYLAGFESPWDYTPSYMDPEKLRTVGLKELEAGVRKIEVLGRGLDGRENGIVCGVFADCVYEAGRRVLYREANVDEIPNITWFMLWAMDRNSLNIDSRMAIAKAFARIGPGPHSANAIEKLRPLLDFDNSADEYSMVQRNAVIALSVLGDARSLEKIKDLKHQLDYVLLSRLVLGDKSKDLETLVVNHLNKCHKHNGTSEYMLIALMLMGKGDSLPIAGESTRHYGKTVRAIILDIDKRVGSLPYARIAMEEVEKNAVSSGGRSEGSTRANYMRATQVVGGLLAARERTHPRYANLKGGNVL